jgi:hypothetical protein
MTLIECRPEIIFAEIREIRLDFDHRHGHLGGVKLGDVADTLGAWSRN